MRLVCWVVIAVLEIGGAGLHAQPLAPERAANLREALEALEATRQPSAQLYERYFEAFPDRFTELRDWLVRGGVREILARGRDWNYGEDYLREMCRTYEHVGHKRYMRKLLRMGVEAGNWGGPADEEGELLRHVPGSMYRSLVLGEACGPMTQASMAARTAVIYQLLPEYADAEVEAIYNSLAWEGVERFALEWFLDGVCNSDQKRCALMSQFRDKYVKPLYEQAEPR
jgi:hypothetical protein